MKRSQANNETDSLCSKVHLERILQIGLNGFLIYFAIYGFRKPWGAARFKGQRALGMKLKDAFSMFQTLGYALGKVVGTFVVPLIPAEKTTLAIAVLPPVSLLFWFGFALSESSPGWMVFFMFLSATPLSFGWSLLYRKIEGRRTGDVLGAILSASYIFASGFCKDMGRIVLNNGVSEAWMPLVTGLWFLLPIELFIYVSQYLPPQTRDEIKVYSKRTKMSLAKQKQLFSEYWPGLSLYFLGYLLVTALRDYRDDFGVEIWHERTGKDVMPSFSTTESIVAIAVVVATACIFAIRTPRNAMLAYYSLTVVGMVLLFVVQCFYLEPHVWFVLTGIGIFFGYAAVSNLFDRMLGALKFGNSTAALLINAADASGYAGTVVLLLYKNFYHSGGQEESGYYDYFLLMANIVAVVGAVCFATSAVYMSRKVSKSALEDRDIAEETGDVETTSSNTETDYIQLLDRP